MSQLAGLQLQLREKTDAESGRSELLEEAKTRLRNLELQLERKAESVDLLAREADVLRQDSTRVPCQPRAMSPNINVFF